ncbi:hypothetical protein RhiirA4_455766 [Rhizophagus irregularis]|uniref:Uncharacterized protein n=1 Tax=Rhizophagus irregularis TaxID=588596 RepID=A0A2I1G5Z7_9GLOM|nr:hypothetical protein RhiirA4_455766 [Rhizophagus irregularis]
MVKLQMHKILKEPGIKQCIYIRTTGNDKNRFTVVLTCSADSSKYPPICIFKEKQLPRGEVIPKGVIYNMRKEWHIWMCQGGTGETEADGSEDDMVYEEIDKLITEFEDENLDELDDNTEIVDN